MKKIKFDFEFQKLISLKNDYDRFELPKRLLFKSDHRICVRLIFEKINKIQKHSPIYSNCENKMIKY